MYGRRLPLHIVIGRDRIKVVDFGYVTKAI